MASHSLVSIRILDVNDNPPELATPYEASICEDAKPGQVCFYILYVLSISITGCLCWITARLHQQQHEENRWNHLCKIRNQAEPRPHSSEYIIVQEACY